MENYSWLTPNAGECTGRQVVVRFHLLNIGIFDLLNDGLQAYTAGTYKRVVNEDSLEKKRKYSLESYEKLAQFAIGTEQTGKVITSSHSGGYNKPARSADEIKQDFRRQYYSQPEDVPIVPSDCFAFSYAPPDDDKKRQAAISIALLFIFKTNDVEDYEQTHGINPLEPSLLSAPQEQPEKPIEISTIPIEKQPEPGNTQPTPPPVNFFHKERSDIWHIGYAGEKATIKHYNGLSYIAEILHQKHGESVSCIALAQMVSSKGRENVVSEGAAINEGLYLDHEAQPINTPKARTEYLTRYNQLRDRLSEIEDLQEHERPPDAILEKAEIEEEMSKVEIALKEKTFAEPNAKKAQSNIKQRLDGAYAAIRKAGMKNLAIYLERNITVDGAFGLSYVGTLTWEIVIE